MQDRFPQRNYLLPNGISWTQNIAMARVPPHGGDGSGGTGRASVDDPRLLASLESQRDEQVLAGRIEYEEERTGEAGRSNSADAFAAWENRGSGCTLVAPRFQKCLFVNHSKEWRGRRDSNPRPLP